MRDGTSPVLSPKEALDSFTVPPDFSVEIVAAEPLVTDPVAADFGPDGRLWVVQMPGYPAGMLDAEQRKAKNGKVVVLEDTNDDGRMDERTVFMQDLNLPRSVSVMKDGVLVAEPPHLWFAKDTDGDLKADRKTAIRKDYGDPRENVEHLPNTPTWGLDNWIHHSNYAKQLRYTGSSWKKRPSVALGQWGLSLDREGRLYTTNNSRPLFVSVLNPHYFARNEHLTDRSPAQLYIARGQEQVWPVRTTRGVDRGYRPGVLRGDDTLKTHTAASGVTINRGTQYPASFDQDAFVPEPAANLVRRFSITESEAGSIKAENPYRRAEFMASTDERFRPVNMTFGPDGSVYVLDMYRGVITHRNFLTPYLKEIIRDRNLHNPAGIKRGRIYRIVYDPEGRRSDSPHITDDSSEDLVDTLSHPNGWWRLTAQQHLVLRKATDVVPELTELALEGEKERGRLHALWTLEGLDRVNKSLVLNTLLDESPIVRASAIRVAEPFLRDGDQTVLKHVSRLARDPSPKVRLQVAASLGEVPHPKADRAWIDLFTSAALQPYLVQTILSGMQGREVDVLGKLVRSDKLEENSLRSLTTFASTIINTEDMSDIHRLFELMAERAEQDPNLVLALLSGVSSQIPGARGKKRHLKLEEKPRALDELVDSSNKQVRNRAMGIKKHLAWPGREGYDQEEQTLITERDKRLFQNGKEVYKKVCVTCHGADGTGKENLGPALAGSQWITGLKNRQTEQENMLDKDLARIVLDGKKGDFGVMPAQRNKLSNREIAAVLTYIRNAWGNNESPVYPMLIEEVRNETEARGKPWTEDALRRMVH